MFIAESFQSVWDRSCGPGRGKETTFTLRALPIGGYVAMAGEEGSAFEGVPAPADDQGRVTLEADRHHYACGRDHELCASLADLRFDHPDQRQLQHCAQSGGRRLVEGSPAEAAGFAQGDVITKVVFADGTVVRPSNFYLNPDVSMDNTDPVIPHSSAAMKRLNKR